MNTSSQHLPLPAATRANAPEAASTSATLAASMPASQAAPLANTRAVAAKKGKSAPVPVLSQAETDQVAQTEEVATQTIKAPPQTEAATSAEPAPILLAQNTPTAQDAISGVTNATAGEALAEEGAEKVAGLVVAPAAAGISGTTMALAGAGGLALAGGGGGGGGGSSNGGGSNGGGTDPNSRYSISEVKLSEDTGAKNDDRITNVKLQTISGKISPSLAGERLAVSVDGGSTWSDAVVNNDTWTALVDLKKEGTTAIQIRTTDASGKATIAITPITITLDTTGPTTTVKTLTLSDDTGVSNSDFITKTESQTLKGTLSAALASDETVWVSVDDGKTWKQATIDKTDWSLSGVKLLGDKPHEIQVKISDLAGNDSKVTSQTYTLDTTAPTSVVQSMALLNDKEVDFSVTQVNQSVTGKLSAPLSSGERVIVSVDNGVTWKDATVASDGNSWLCEVELKYGTGTLKATVIDAAGNINSASPGSVVSQKYTVTQPLLTPLYDAKNNAIAPSFKGLVITGQGVGYYSGLISNAGDVNGDGLDDLIIGMPPFTDTNTVGPIATPNTGRNYVVFGKEGTTAISLDDIAAGKGGFVISGQNANDYSGSAVANIGDINGDGFDDLLIGAPNSAPASGDKAGRTYVVFGKADTSAVSLADVAVGKGGFVINGQNAGEQSGFSVSDAGDVNGDGLLDLIVGAPFSDVNGTKAAGRSFVVFGKTDTTAVDLFKVANGTGGFVINNSVEDDWNGFSVSSLGDVNDDGLADLFVGVPFGDAGNTKDAEEGRGYVVFGKKDTAAIKLTDVAAGKGGFVVNGVSAKDHAGHSVSSAGDVNGDGLADLIIGAPFGNSATSLGDAYVVFGKKDTSAINLADVVEGKGGGFAMKGEKPRENTGLSVSSAGDINGDGLADLLVGAIDVGANGKTSSGRSYVVFGKTDNKAINLSEVAAGVGGFAVDGADEGGNFGRSVSTGDVNGDGLSDLIIGASGDRTDLTINKVSGNTTPAQIGRSFVIFGGQQTASVVDQMGTTGDDTLTGTSSSESFVGNTGNDTLIGNGGADVLYGGNGNDTFVLNTDNVAKLINGGVVDGRHARVDGGSGVDTLWLGGTGISLDLTKISNAGAGTPDGFSTLNSIERINLSSYGNGSGTSNNTLRLSAQDVQDIAGINTWKVPSANNAVYHQLMIDGDATDKVTVTSAKVTEWVYQEQLFTNNNVSYDVWINDATHTQLLVNHAVAVSVVV